MVHRPLVLRKGPEKSLCGRLVDGWLCDGNTLDGVPFAEASVGCRVCIRVYEARVKAGTS